MLLHTMIQYELNICLNIYENHNLCIKDRTYILEPSSTEEASIFEPATIIENWKLKKVWMKKSIIFSVLLGVFISFTFMVLTPFNIVWRQINSRPDPDLINQQEALKSACKKSNMQLNVKEDHFSFEDLNHFNLGKKRFSRFSCIKWYMKVCYRTPF